jgi:uncharacterized damage-inducible protein DinB
MSMKEAMLSEFDHETAMTRRVLQRVPAADHGWKPHPKSSSLGALATHLSNLLSWVETVMTKDGFDLAGSSGPRPTIPSTNAELLAIFDRNAAAARRHLASASDAELIQPWTLRAGEHAIFTQPRIGVLRSMVIGHSIHHRGQMTVYLRLRDVPVPSIYGPSADEQ